MSFEKLKNMTDEEKKKTVPTQGRNPDQSVGEEEKETKEDTGHEFDLDSEACGTCGGCGGEE